MSKYTEEELRERRREGDRIRHRRYRDAHPERDRIANKKYAKTHVETLHKIRRNYLSNHPEWKLFHLAKARAKKFGLEFSITIDDIHIPRVCPYLGIELTNIIGEGRQKFNISLDRIDSNRGYVPDNIQVISELANRMKNNATEEQLIAFSKSVLLRDKWKYIDQYLSELCTDIYEQPDSDGHTTNADEVISSWFSELPKGATVLDLGCGTGFCQPMFEKIELNYAGICLGNDYHAAVTLGRNVKFMDFNFLEYADNSFDLLFSRHSLEHSPFPLISLMEWHRVSSKYLCVIIPNPEHFTYVGRNHYSVMTSHQMVWLLRRAGWKLIRHELLEQEFRFLCEKQPRISYEGYVEAPLNQKVHDFEHTEFLGGR